MSNPQPRSAGVTAAATLIILYCVAALLLWGYFFLPLLNLPADEAGKHLYEREPLGFALFATLPPALIAAGIRIAVGLFHLKPWARLATLTAATIQLALCLTVIALWPFETFVIPHHFVTPAQQFGQRLMVSFVIMLFPVSVWWLFLFRMNSVKAQFLPAQPQERASTGPVAEKL
jgi:hypothetical protein